MRIDKSLTYTEFHRIMKRINPNSYSSKKKHKPDSGPTQFSSMEEIDRYYDCSDYEDFRNEIHKRFGI